MPLQDLIHQVTEGSGSRVLTLLLVFFGMVGLAVWYDVAVFRNLATIEGMDAAQLARNISEGEGFTTQFVRPLGLHLLEGHRGEGGALLANRQPDLANAPLYPALLAGVLKVMPFPYPDTPSIRQFSVYVPDLWIAIFNQLLFFLAVWMVFRLGRRLYDEPVAWVSAAVLAGADLFWRFSVSGLSTLLLIVVFLALVEVLSRLEPEPRGGPARSEAWLTRQAMLAGALAGVTGLTRYSFGWIIVAVVAFLATVPTPRRPVLIASCLGAFLVVLAPWVMRNYSVSGTPFGTAGYALLEETSLFPGLDLERTLHPDFSLMTAADLWHKLVVGVRQIIEQELPRLGGSWVTAFFLAGLLVPFRNPTLSRLRFFLVVSLLVLTAAQSLGRTGLTTESVEVNSENLLVVLAPMVFLFGAGFFFVLLAPLGAGSPAFRSFAPGAFVLLTCLPLFFTLAMPARTALAYPPYFPPYIQKKAQALEREDLVMADLPWAVAWYGHRQSVWLSLKYHEDVPAKFRNDFSALNSQGKPIRALYLSSRTTASVKTQALEDWVRREGRAESWEPYVSDWQSFALLGVYLFREVPSGFPLKSAALNDLPELFLMDSERKSGKP